MNDCPNSEEYKERQRERLRDLEEEVVKLRTGLARLAFKAGLEEHVPGKPGREAPFEVLEKCAGQNERGWNALLARLMDNVGACSHCECPEAHEKPEPERHTPGCESWQGKGCSCPPYSMEG